MTKLKMKMHDNAVYDTKKAACSVAKHIASQERKCMVVMECVAAYEPPCNVVEVDITDSDDGALEIVQNGHNCWLVYHKGEGVSSAIGSIGHVSEGYAAVHQGSTGHKDKKTFDSFAEAVNFLAGPYEYVDSLKCP